ncbi:MAG: Gfo/Idh/MocA family oxidoreductase, partial [Clostridia bacterium]
MNHKYRLAIIGNGMICNAAHLPALALLREKGMVEVVSVADIRSDAARETAERYHIPAWYEDPQKMLDELQPDWVSVCTPNCRHEWSIAALKAGANVMCEKPLALTYAEAQEEFRVAKEMGKLLFPCQSRRWSADMDFAQDVVRKGLLGKPYFAEIDFVRRYGIPTWGMFHMKDENGGGPFCDLGVHFLDAFLWMLGNPRVEAVSGKAFDVLAKQGEDVLLSIKESGAYIGTFTPRPYKKDEFSVEDCAAGSVRIAGNIAINFKFTWALFQPTKKHIVICGDKGGLDVDEMMLYQNVGGYQGETKLKYFDNRPYAGRAFDAHYYMYEHVYNVLEGKEEPRVKPEETLNVVSAIEAFYRSAEENREIRTEEL